jgi:proline racemase
VAIAHVVVIALCGYFLSRVIVGERRALEGAQVAERQAARLKEERDAAREALMRAKAEGGQRTESVQ